MGVSVGVSGCGALTCEWSASPENMDSLKILFLQFHVQSS